MEAFTDQINAVVFAALRHTHNRWREVGNAQFVNKHKAAEYRVAKARIGGDSNGGRAWVVRYGFGVYRDDAAVRINHATVDYQRLTAYRQARLLAKVGTAHHHLGTAANITDVHAAIAFGAFTGADADDIRVQRIGRRSAEAEHVIGGQRLTGHRLQALLDTHVVTGTREQVLAVFAYQLDTPLGGVGATGSKGQLELHGNVAANLRITFEHLHVVG